MRQTLLLLTVVAILLPGRPAFADRVDRLIKILKTDPSYKVRLQVAIALGKLKDKRAVGALIFTLRDSNETVQGIAAAALGQIGDRRAVPSLKALESRTSNSFVRRQAQKALSVLGGGGDGGAGGGIKKGARFFVTVGKLGNKSNKGGKRLSEALGKALTKHFDKSSNVTTTWTGGGKPSAAALAKRRMKGFVLDASILSMTHKQSGSNIEITCAIRVTLSTYPANSMKAFYSGSASMAVPASSFNPQSAYDVYKDLVDGVAGGARQHIMQSYLNHQ
jgi:hypothetical protein